MRFPTFQARILSFILSLLFPLLSVSCGIGGITACTGGEMRQVMRKTGGFMAGVCHPDDNYDAVLDANIGWIREDLPFPFDKNGNLRPAYVYYKTKLAEYAAAGLRVLAITPKPADYLAFGLDVREPEDIPRIQAVARFYVSDLKGLVDAFQVANEMGVDRFTQPYTMDEAARFIGLQLEAMYSIRGDVLIGYNYGGPGMLLLPLRMLRYNAFCDYVGLDLYFGSFENIIKSIVAYTAILRLFHVVTGKPIILTEFGYLGCGEPKTDEEKREILEQYGVSSEEEAAADIDAFIARLPKPLREDIESSCAAKSDEEKVKLLFRGEYASHIYRDLPEGFCLRGYPHTPQGQAKFYADLIPRLRSLRFCAGAFIYMWRDANACYVCGQPDCPVETGWGVIDGQGQPKDAYYAVQKAFAP